MTGGDSWEFTDDRGRRVAAGRRPQRVVAYIRAGAALWDLGVRPVAVYGSNHDGELPDPVKAGSLPLSEIAYLGAGEDIDGERLAALDPDLIVDVTYDGSLYALPGAAVKHLEAADRSVGVPAVALSVGTDADLPGILQRFTALASALGADPQDRRLSASAEELTATEEALRAAVAARSAPLTVLTLSAAGPDLVHLARPQAWPELRHLASLGVHTVDPGPGGGANWLTSDWEYAASLRADLVLVDSRAHATRPEELTTNADWRSLTAGAQVQPWNPETPCSPAAYARFIRSVADAAT
ncbi:ABC transporter substrate-binding protein [Peterkaempfera sp. SMS 1(5)a]|uniref:ABC transporter substrate-binding protein n=1 Tax=Peterkaempfera podocarpi TaxID=3232308 RepID=UPI00366D8A72